MQSTATWTVLLVEDNPGDANLVRTCIADLTGIELVHVPNAVQAHRFLQRKHPFELASLPHLVLLDLRMPIFDGSTVLKAMRESRMFDGIPVVVFTSSTLFSDKMACQELGATAYINKPTDWPAWQATMFRIFQDFLPKFSI